MKKKHLCDVLLLILVATCIFALSKDWKYGVTTKVTNGSDSGLEFHIRRGKRSTPRDIYQLDGIKLEHLTRTGWTVESENVILMESDRIPAGFTDVYSLEWLREQMPGGIYRIVNTLGSYGTEKTEKTYRAPFLLIKWSIKNYLRDKIAGHQYSIEMEEITSSGLSGELSYLGDGREKRELFLYLTEEYSLEKKTIKGWDEVAKVEQSDGWSTWVLREGTTNPFDFKWEKVCGELEPGSYRIVQPFYQKINDNTEKKEANIYITFEVEK